MRKIIAIAVVATVATLGIASQASAEVATKRPPASCTRALAAAENIDDVASQAFHAIGDFFDQTQQSAQAHTSGGVVGVTTFLTEMRTNMDAMTARLTTLKSDIDDARTRYLANSVQCRAGK